MSLFFKRSKKFPVPPDTRVFTTIHVMKANVPITLVAHELDGDWQFMDAEPIEDYTKVAMVVALGEVIKKDKSVLQVADLPRGYQAARSNEKEDWQISKLEYSEEEIREMGFLCSSCGNYHKDIPFAYGPDAPYKYAQIPEEEREKRCVLTADICIIDDEAFYIKGTLFIQVENNEDFSWNIWVQLSKADFLRMEELWKDENRILEYPYTGKIATQLDVYPDTLDLQVKVHTQQVGYRPGIELTETQHPLFFEQENGITMERITSFAKQILYHQ